MKQKLKLIFVSLIFLLGLVLFLYPLANKYENKVEVEETKKKKKKTVEKLHEESNDEENPLNDLYSDMKAYNEKIYENKADESMNDEEAAKAEEAEIIRLAHLPD